MQNYIVPNYKDLFTDGLSYEDAVKNLSSDTIITICIAINNELNTPEERSKLQKRIFKALCRTFTSDQRRSLILALKAFNETTEGSFAGLIFGRRYLLEMILKELNNFRELAEVSEEPREFDFFKAYLLIVQAVNENDSSRIDFKNIPLHTPHRKYELIWKPTIPQFEFSEKPHLMFEIFKLAIFMNFARENYRDALKEYLTKHHFNNISQLFASFHQVNNTALSRNPEAMLQKLAYISPNIHVDTQHLIAQSVNEQTGITAFFIRTLKAFPLYLKKERGYMVVDPDFYFRKTYLGPFFDLHHQTSLNEREKFNQYSINVSAALEQNLLKPLLTVVSKNNADVAHFDDMTPDCPDGYIRIGKMIFLFEYKAYIFKEELAQYPEVKDVVSYIDEKFVRTEKGKKKGITQLRDQINILMAGGFHFDKQDFFTNGADKIRVYPVILHHDFMFGLPGINDYLNDKFQDSLVANDHYEIMPVTLMNLSVLLDMALGKRDMHFMESMLIEYFNYQQRHHAEFQVKQHVHTYLKAHISFDELFQMVFVHHTQTPEGTQKETMDKLMAYAGIIWADFQRPLA